jgi:hypothetical protein
VDEDKICYINSSMSFSTITFRSKGVLRKVHEETAERKDHMGGCYCITNSGFLLFGLNMRRLRWMTAAPRYNVIVATRYDSSTFKLNVIEKQLKRQVACDHACVASGYPAKPTLYLFDVQSKQAKSLPIQLPALTFDTKPFTAEVTVPELDQLEISSSTQSPDGYQYVGGGLPLFIARNGNRLSLVWPIDGDVVFLGWVVSEKGK